MMYKYIRRAQSETNDTRDDAVIIISVYLLAIN